MKQINMYQTRDGKKFNSPEDAESHCLSKAHGALIEILKDHAPFVDNPYTVAQKVILGITANHKGKTDIQTLQLVLEWLSDAMNSLDEE